MAKGDAGECTFCTTSLTIRRYASGKKFGGNICRSCRTLSNAGVCPSCGYWSAAGYPCSSCDNGPVLIAAHPHTAPTAPTAPMSSGSPFLAAFSRLTAKVPGLPWQEPDADPGTAPLPEPAPRCVTCDRELCHELDAYYGKEPQQALFCSKCRG